MKIVFLACLIWLPVMNCYMRCKGQDNGCCTKYKQCKLGEGDCDHDSQCAGSLICGKNNCPWGDNDDCCMRGMRCRGQDNGCCTQTKRCKLGEGDCDRDLECAGTLTCGTNNCPWGDNDDCCMKANTCRIDVLSIDGKYGGMLFHFNKKQLPELKFKMLRFRATNSRTGKTGQVVVWSYNRGGSKGDSHGLFDKGGAYPKTGDWKVGDAVIIKDSSICNKVLRCNGQDSGCCTKSTPCGLGEGDCDVDADCAGSLVCGTNNCPWGDRDDCCTPA